MIELYRTAGCPYCAKVQETLDSLDLEYTIHDVPSSRRKRTTVKEISGQTGVPVLVDTEHDITGMPESADIIDHLERTYG